MFIFIPGSKEMFIILSSLIFLLRFSNIWVQAFDCFLSNVAYQGAELSKIPDISSSTLCQMECQNSTFCNHFTYNLPNQICSLLTSKLGSNSSNGFTSGPKFCRVGCLQAKTDFRGIDLSTLVLVTSPYACQRHCQKNDECYFFTYNHIMSVCILKSRVFKANIDAITFLAPLSTSGPKFCAEACFELNILFGGSTVQTGANISDSFSCQTETTRPSAKRRKRKGATNPGPSGPMGGKKRSPGPNFSLASQERIQDQINIFSRNQDDVMVVGEPSLMGGEFGEEDERMISRLENAQYDPAAAAAQAQGSIGPMDPDYVGGPSGWPGGPSGPPPPPLPSSSGHQPKLEQDIKKSPKNC